MNSEDQVELLERDVDQWNRWRLNEGYGETVKLSGSIFEGANLEGADLSYADLRTTTFNHAILRDASFRNSVLSEAEFLGADLRGADFTEAFLFEADLTRANLQRAILSKARLERADLHGASLHKAILDDANLMHADLAGANLTRANLTGAQLDFSDLSGADISRANLTGASLERAVMVRTAVDGAFFEDCRIYGISAWDLQGAPKKGPAGFIVTPSSLPAVRVDELDVAQFVYLLLTSSKIRSVINTVGQKGVLILGRFTEERKHVLDSVRAELHRLGFVPMIFDFDRPTDRDFTETIMTLAGFSKFIVADITNPSSSPLELQATVPNYMVPFVPIIQEDEKPFSMFKDLYGKFDWVLKPLEYDNAENLVANLQQGVIDRALEKHSELVLKKAEELSTLKLKDL